MSATKERVKRLMLAKGMTVKQKETAKRTLIVSSEQFREWWDWRRTISPLPSDPYRAFMIDLSLNARIWDKVMWKRRVNRGDVINIDYPLSPEGKPAYKPRMPSRKEQKRAEHWKPRPSRVSPELEKSLEEEVDLFSKELGVRRPLLHIMEHGSLRSHQSFNLATGVSEVFIGIGGEKRKPSPQTIAVLAHELGHAAHFNIGTEILQKKGLTEAIGSGTLARERAAWSLAEPYLQKRLGKVKGGLPIAKWSKKFALGTYLGTVRKTTEVR